MGGFVLLSAACILHAAGLWWAVESLPHFRRGASLDEMTSALETASPGQTMARTMAVYGISGTVLMAGVVVLAMGVVDYAAEVWRREP